MDVAEHKAFRKRMMFIFSVLVVLFFGGSFFYHKVENWRLLDAMYFSAATMTTVGYGDLSPKTDLGKIFSIFYLFTSVGIALYGLSLFASHFVEMREDMWVQRLSDTTKHTKKFREGVKKLFSWDSEKLTENDKIEKK